MSFGRLVGAGCEMHEAVVFTDRQVFDPEYPPGIQGFHSRIVSAQVAVFECAEVAYPDYVEPNFQLAFLSTLIDTPEHGNGSVSNVFIHQAYVTDARFAANASSVFGLDARVVDSIDVSSTPNPDGSKTIEILVPEAAPDYTIVGTTDLQGNLRVHPVSAYVFGDETKVGYFILDYRGIGNSASPAIVNYGAGSYWAAHSPSPNSQANMVHDFELDATITFQKLQPATSE
jgi:hypothetical protein